ncbi:hypothetical protein GCM10010286_54140 [Streptomyces toxytricini]|nr:hypothetical protein GCM10010286_54140 [Streptomyces toxytricini]
MRYLNDMTDTEGGRADRIRSARPPSVFPLAGHAKALLHQDVTAAQVPPGLCGAVDAADGCTERSRRIYVVDHVSCDTFMWLAT